MSLIIEKYPKISNGELDKFVSPNIREKNGNAAGNAQLQKKSTEGTKKIGLPWWPLDGGRGLSTHRQYLPNR